MLSWGVSFFLSPSAIATTHACTCVCALSNERKKKERKEGRKDRKKNKNVIQIKKLVELALTFKLWKYRGSTLKTLKFHDSMSILPFVTFIEDPEDKRQGRKRMYPVFMTEK